MKTRKEQMTAGGVDGYNNFLGDDNEYQDWYGVIGQSRDSDALERSNCRIALEMLGGESDNVRVERYGHWAVGWIEEVYVKPGTPEEQIARKIEADLLNYPVLDEEDWCQEEQEEAEKVWKSCYNCQERIKYIRSHRQEFEFANLADIRACVRGEYFVGYASELIR